MSVKKFFDDLKNIQVTIGLITTVCSVVAALFIFAVSYQLAPVVQDIRIIREEVQANEQLDKTEHPNFATKADYENLTKQIERIQTTVDEINRYLRK